MDLTIQPDLYAPNIGDQGLYIDYIPSHSILQHGIICPCGSRKDKVFKSNSNFSSHIKTKIHQKWIECLNNNRSNFYVELEKSKDVIQNQRIVIARLEKEVASRNLTIDYLTNQLHISRAPIVTNLIDL